MKKTTLIVTIALLMGVIQSCNDDFELSGPYKRIPIIYGILDAGSDTQFVMINRSFLGDANALDFATVQDSALYKDVSARIYWGETEAESIDLDSMTIYDKDLNGIFYAPEQLVYYATSPEGSAFRNAMLNDNNGGKLFTLDIVADGESISATTKVPVPTGMDIDQPTINTSVTARFASSFNSDNNEVDYTPINFIVECVENSLRQEGFLRFNYTEILTDMVTEREKSIIIPLGIDTPQPGSGCEAEFVRPGDFFFQQIAQKAEMGDDVWQRSFTNVDYIVLVAGEDLTTYLDIGEPVSDVGQERPSYSNINDGDGIGIFSSRGTFSFSKSIYNNSNGGTSATIQTLVQGEITNSLCFCDPSPGTQFACDNVLAPFCE